MKLVTPRIDLATHEEIRKTFEQMDVDHTGHVTTRHIARTLKEFGITGIPAQDLLTQADTDGDGRLSFEDISSVIEKHAFP